ncbi:PREDICTED: proteasome inhibitor PI31 subunit [Dinoponera quadriceps]|uniref:Proteasome inhibitor PI31 subunit n=1 Tax=Dinoponera quadriceps TaxID=609295 RepID=A0A6P3XB84_DINQU|nr:PREDICTED: proteasome inhibitor PI31 subunit [Dinoponera quadriceps]
MASDTFGFDLLYKLHYNEIQKKEDVIILFAHWYLVKHGLRCIGTGDNIIFDASEKGSELLPKEWNIDLSYTLRYIRNGKLFLLSGIKADDEILINLVKLEDDSITNIAFAIERTVLGLHGPLETIIPSYEKIIRRLQKDFLKPLYKFSLIDLGNVKEAGTQTTASNTSSCTRDRPPLDCKYWSRNPIPDNTDPGRVGAADLYPGGQGGGMIFNPFGGHPYARVPESLGIPGILPSGAIPPGARFDPIVPPDLEPPRPSRLRPDADHLPPPGYGDMFM